MSIPFPVYHKDVSDISFLDKLSGSFLCLLQYQDILRTLLRESYTRRLGQLCGCS